MRIRFLLAGLTAMTLLVAACGADTAVTTTAAQDGGASTTAAPDETTPDTEPAQGDGSLPEIDPFEVSGDIVTAGSSTVFPLSEAVAALFEDEGYGGQITIDSIGSGAGIERFCVAGESDIANASRAIEEEEIAACGEIGRTPIEFRVGTDALAVAVSTSNYFIETLTIEQLATAFGGAETWDEVDPDFPAHPIQLFSPGTDSGTFDYFVEAVFEEDPEPLLNADPQLSEDDAVLVQGVAGDGCTEGDVSTSCAIGYFGYAYYVANEGSLRALTIEGVEPNAETVLGDYPLARPLFIYSDASIMSEKPQVAQFISFYLGRVNEVIDAVGYFPAPEENLDAAKATLLEAAGDALSG